MTDQVDGSVRRHRVEHRDEIGDQVPHAVRVDPTRAPLAPAPRVS